MAICRDQTGKGFVMKQGANVEIFDFSPKPVSVVTEVLVGLSRPRKALPPKLLYDKIGSEIFEKICNLKEYYPTRAESEILTIYAHEMSWLMGENPLIIEPGAGSGEKIKYLLPFLQNPAGYVPIEISREMLLQMAGELRAEFPEIPVYPICADFTEEVRLPSPIRRHKGKKVVFFPGSTIGNFAPAEAVSFLKRLGRIMGAGGGLLIGADLKKDPRILNLAYDDPQGVTAAFNLNLLRRLNDEASANFDPEFFEHEAYYNEELGRVEMHLKSKVDHTVKVHESLFRFQEGESIHTESSYKYTEDEFIGLCAEARLECKRHWKDTDDLFGVYYFEKM